MTRRLRAALVLSVVALPAAAQQPPHGAGHSMTWGPASYFLAEGELGLAPTNDPPRDLALSGWVGNATGRWWYEATLDARSGPDGIELAALRGWLIAPFWDLQVGAWVDVGTIPPTLARMRGGPAIGLHGLAPGWFDVEASLEVSGRGAFAAAVTASYDLYLTQGIILQPRVAALWQARSVSRDRVSAGLAEADIGVRARWELSRRFAPFIGVASERRDLGFEVRRERQVTIGLRAWR